MNCQPDTAALVTHQQETAAPVNCQPDAVAHDTRQPDAATHATRQPDAAAHGTRQPDAAAHDTRQPDATAHDTCQPDAAAHDTRQPDAVAPAICQPDAAAPIICQPDIAVQSTHLADMAPKATSPAGVAPHITPTDLNTGNLTQLWKQQVNNSLTVAFNTERIMNNLAIKDKEIDLLNDEMKTAYTLIDQLMKRVDDLDNKENIKLKAVNINPNIQKQTSETVNKCLLLGDSNLQIVKQSDLGENCSVKTISEANVNLSESWVCEDMHTIPSECIIYYGLYDISEGMSQENILNRLSSLITDLRAKISKMEIYICHVSPVPPPLEIQCKIFDYNDHLMKWAPGPKSLVSRYH